MPFGDIKVDLKILILIKEEKDFQVIVPQIENMYMMTWASRKDSDQLCNGTV